jgi:radical SAM superfamily enzyme YgiQ (UPF0313 family)
LLPAQTLTAEFVDIVVQGQGEDALLEIVQRVEDDASMKGIDGVGYKENGQIVFNQPRKTSSLACPYNCAYCTNAGVYGRGWNGLEPVQVAEETTTLASRYNLNLLWIVDDNFLVDRARALGIAEELIKRDAKFEWSIQASTNLVDRFTVNELKLLHRSGLAQVQMGADSGSRRVLDLMNKQFQKIDHIHAAADKLHRAGIRPAFNMIFAYPGETEEDRIASVRLIMDICRRYPGAELRAASDDARVPAHGV